MHLVRLPKENENMAEATLGAWLVETGAQVQADTPIASLITDKAEFEIEAETAGVLLARAVPVKSTLPVGAVLAAIGQAGEEPPDLVAMNAEFLGTAAPAPAGRRRGAGLGDRDVRATPAARRMATEAAHPPAHDCHGPALLLSKRGELQLSRGTCREQTGGRSRQKRRKNKRCRRQNSSQTDKKNNCT